MITLTTSLLYLISKFALWKITNFIFCICVLLESYFPFHNVANPIRLKWDFIQFNFGKNKIFLQNLVSVIDS